ncbi:MAG TPA: fumarylacetoacetate hydrolase family protein [Gemmataceae bacterium]|nr:fumarylacetoacetate hydrolase family protein [Gemmataceae bacterium]
MQLCKAQLADGRACIGEVAGDYVHCLAGEDGRGTRSLSDILYAEDPATAARDFFHDRRQTLPVQALTFPPPVDHQEIWAAGVTYKRSQEARERESAAAARFYDLVYSAPRPELFFKATAARVVGSGDVVRIRRDSRWSVPEPELALVLSPRMDIVGYTIGNDMSARDIEGENPLYLPQAKIYDRSCALGPVVTLTESMPALDEVTIRMSIERRGSRVFEGGTSLRAMNRKLEELVHWLGVENNFPHGAVLLTGTGVVPPDDFTLAGGDLITIEIAGIGRLVNRVVQ